MKRLALMMMVVVLAILVQAMVEVDNPSFSYDHHYLNHPPSLTPFLHSLPIISLSPYNDAKSRRNRSNRQNPPNAKQSPGPVNTTPTEKEAHISKLEEAKIACRKECKRKAFQQLKRSGESSLIRPKYRKCFRDCLKREMQEP
jgi:hypothetical protein